MSNALTGLSLRLPPAPADTACGLSDTGTTARLRRGSRVSARFWRRPLALASAPKARRKSELITRTARILLRSLYEAKRRLFPDFCFERWFPAWHSVHAGLIAGSRQDFADDVLGHKMYLDDLDCLQLSINRVYEPFETRFLEEQLRPGQVVVDIGANIGYYTLQFCRKVGPQGRVYAFEPAPDNTELLKRNLATNGYRNATPIQAAVCEFTGMVQLFYNPTHKADHRIYDPQDVRQSLEVPAVRLDDYFAKVDREIDLIKMDIQGAEYRALRGMSELLSRNKNVALVTEFWPHGLAKSGAKPVDFLQGLAALGFDFFELDEARARAQAVTLPYLAAKAETKNRSTDCLNLFCKRPQPKRG